MRLPSQVFETCVSTSSTTAAKLGRGKSANLPRTRTFSSVRDSATSAFMPLMSLNQEFFIV